jgi:hypothetical protein
MVFLRSPPSMNTYIKEILNQTCRINDYLHKEPPCIFITRQDHRLEYHSGKLIL